MALRNSDAVLGTLVAHTIGYAQEIPMARVAQATIPSGVKAYLRANLRDRFQAEILRYGPFSRVQPLAPSTPHLHELFFAHAAEGYVYPREEYLADLENAAHFTENYVCRPRWTLISFLFHDAPVISTTTLFTRLEYVTEYVYLPQLLRRMVTQKQLQEIGRDDCALLIRQIDAAVVREHTPRELALLTRPIFDYFLYGAQPWELHIPLKPILLFFADKELHTVEELIQGLSQSKNSDRISLAELADMCDDHLTSAPPSAKTGAAERDAKAPEEQESALGVSGAAGGEGAPSGVSAERAEDGDSEACAGENGESEAGVGENGESEAGVGADGESEARAEADAASGIHPVAADETGANGRSDARMESEGHGVQPAGVEEPDTMDSRDADAPDLFHEFGETSGQRSSDGSHPGVPDNGATAEGDIAVPGNGATTSQVLSGAGARSGKPADIAAIGAPGSNAQNAAGVSVAPPEHQETAGTGIPQVAEHVISGRSGGSAVGQPRPATAGTPATLARLNLERMITPEQRKRFIAVLCDRDADFYELVISRLNIMRTWSEAAAYIRELFEINSVDPWRDEAITFTDIVQQRFGTQGQPAV